VLRVLVAGVFAGCAGNGSSMMTPGDDTAGGGDDGPVAFTAGVSTLAGMSDAGYVDGARKVAQFSDPVNVAYRDGLLYVADFDNGKLRVIDVDTHDTATIPTPAGFKRPFGLAFAPDGTLYVSTDNDQAGNHTPMSGTIWKVNLDKKTAVVVASSVGRPRGLVVLPDGRLAAADYLHHVVELIDVGTGKATPIAGSWDAPGMVDGAGAVARFSTPYYVALRSDGKLMVSDYDNNRIRLVELDGATVTLAGTTAAGATDGAMSAAQFSHPQAMSMAANGDVYITDVGNFRIRRITGDQVQTLAGDGKGGFVDADNPLAAELYGLEGLSVVPDGSMVYFADGNRGEPVPYNRIRQLKLN
jgi:DNA-binding beta-propeller fold protein YncE